MEEELQDKVGMSEEHFNMLLEGKEITDIFTTTKGETVTIRFLSDSLFLLIIRRKAEILNGAPAESLNAVDMHQVEFTATLDIAVISGPKGWILGNSAAYPDRSTKREIHRRVLQHYQEILGMEGSGEVLPNDEAPSNADDEAQNPDNADTEPSRTPKKGLSGIFKK